MKSSIYKAYNTNKNTIEHNRYSEIGDELDAALRVVAMIRKF